MGDTYSPVGVRVTSTGVVEGATIPPGVIFFTAGAIPAGYLECNGAAVNRGTFLDLFNAIGTTYGAGDGSTTFNLPDMRGRVPVGIGTHGDVNALGDNDGQAVGDRRPRQSHYHTMPQAQRTKDVDPETATTDQGNTGNTEVGPSWLTLRAMIKI